MTNILVVEDDKNQSLLYKKELTEEGYRVFIARNGREAVFMVGLNPPDLVILDINIPQTDSMEVIEKVLGENNGIPLVIDSACYNFNDDGFSGLKRTIKEILDEKGSAYKCLDGGDY